MSDASAVEKKPVGRPRSLEGRMTNLAIRRTVYERVSMAASSRLMKISWFITALMEGWSLLTPQQEQDAIARAAEKLRRKPHGHRGGGGGGGGD